MTHSPITAAEIIRGLNGLPANTLTSVAVVTVKPPLSPGIKAELEQAGFETEQWGDESRVYRGGK